MKLKLFFVKTIFLTGTLKVGAGKKYDAAPSGPGSLKKKARIYLLFGFYNTKHRK
jgi:hypothetical protein